MSEQQIWYWVTPLDDPDALGDYGGYTFTTHDEAKKFIEAEYAEYERLRREGYYEPDSGPPLLVIETVETIKTETVEPVDR